MGLCRLFGYSKQAYYKQLACYTRQQQSRQAALDLVQQVRCQLPRLGTRKLHYLLQANLKSKGIGRDKLFTLLREQGLLVPKKRRYTRTTNSTHWMRKYPNTVKHTTILRPEQVWVADITYIETMGSFHYLHLVTDAYSKQIMGYRLSAAMRAEDTANALKMAISNRKYPSRPLIHHSDRGLQYCSALYTKILQDNHITISMTEQSDPYENAIAERVNGILKDEFGLADRFEELEQLQLQTKQSIHLYNHVRPHISNEMLTPVQMHLQEQIPIKKYKKKAQVKPSLPVLD